MAFDTRTEPKPMDCPEFLSRYSDYDDSLVPHAEADRFRRHMAECPSCMRYDRVLRKGRMLARQLPAVEPSDDFVPRLRVRLWRESHWRGDRGVGPMRVAAALPAVTILLVVMTGLALVAGGESGAADAPPAVRLAGPVPDHRVSGPPALPVATPLVPREWVTEWGAERAARVDRDVASSYSPLVVGPPAYRSAPPPARVYTSTYRTLD